MPWMKSISNKLNITIHVIAWCLSQVHCDLISNRLWCHQQNLIRASETRDRCKNNILFTFLLSFMDSLCRVRNKTMYVLSWRTTYTLTRVLFGCLFPSLPCHSRERINSSPLDYIHHSIFDNYRPRVTAISLASVLNFSQPTSKQNVEYWVTVQMQTICLMRFSWHCIWMTEIPSAIK